MLTAALISLEVFAVVALADGVYFHLLKFRLFARSDSRYEHLLHTIHALFFPALVLFLFLRQESGPLLWATAGLVAADFVVEMLDVVCERASRASLGGLTTGEYAVHVLAITSRVASFTLALAARPAEAWLASAGTSVEMPLPSVARLLCWAILAGGVAMAAVHMWLLRPHFEQSAAT